MQTILRKLSSRKLWMAIAGVVTGIALALGVEQSAVTTVAGAITALASVVSYVLAEGRIDAASVKTSAENVQAALDLLGSKTSDGQQR